MRQLLANLLSWMFVLGTLVAAAHAGEAPMETMSDLPRKARLALFTAQQELETGTVDKAIAELENYLDRPERENYLLRYHLANAYVRADKRDKAVENYQRCVALEPRYADAWENLGQIAFSLQRYDVAAPALAKASETSEAPQPELLYYAAAAYVMADNAENAIPITDRLLSGALGEPQFDWYRLALSACARAEEHDHGNSVIETMLEQFPSKPDAWYLGFQFAASFGDYRIAARALTITGYLRPLTREEKTQLGDLYAAIGVPWIGADYYAASVADSTTAGTMERLASAYIAAHERDEALDVLERAVRENPTWRLYSLLGDLHYMEERYEESLAAFRECAKLDPEQGRAFLMMGYCAYEIGRAAEARSYCTEALKDPRVSERAETLISRLDEIKVSTSGGRP